MTSASRLRWLAALLLLTAGVLSAAYWWRLTINQDQLRINAVEQASKRAAQLAELQAHHVEAMLLGIDLSLRQFRDALQAENQSGAELIAHNVLSVFPKGAIVHLARIDASGYFQYTTVPLAGPVYVGDRDYFQYFQKHVGEDRLFINKPIFSRSAHEWVILITRPIVRNGRFDGAAFISLSPTYFSSMLGKLKMEAGDVGTLLLSDGTYMARSQDLEASLGKSIELNRPLILEKSPANGVFRANGSADSTQRIYAWNKLQGYPLIVTIGLDETAILAPVEKIILTTKQRSAVAIGLVLVLFIVIATLLLRAARQQDSLANSETMLRSILESTENGILVIRVDGTVLDANRRFYELWRIPDAMRDAKKHRRQLAYALAQLSDPKTFKRVVSTLSRSDDEHSDTVRFKDGRIFNRYSRTFLHGGQRARLWSFRDITMQKQAEAQLRLAASVFSNSYEGIMITDTDNMIVDVNPGFTRITGYEVEEVLGKNPRVLSSGKHPETFYQEMWASLQANDFWRGEIWNRHKSGRHYPEMLSLSVVRDKAGTPQHYIGVFSDISQLKEHVAELDRIAHYDMLTGAPNRRLLSDRLSQAIARTNRSGKGLAVCCLDLDSFKPVNDRFGHGMGDLMLVEIAQRLQGVLRAEDTLARLGGDEFVLLLNEQDRNNQEDTTLVLDRVLSAIRAPVVMNDIELNITGSIGITLYPEDNVDADTLIRHADQAMYRAKNAGKNCYRFFDPEHDRNIRAHFHQLQRISDALRKNEFFLHYQPKVNLMSGEVIGMEALIRWQHPEEGLLLPDNFLPMLEGSDLEHVLGEWVIESALNQMHFWRGMDLDLAVSVNVSANHLLRADFPDRLQHLLGQHPLVSPKKLELEIIEAAALNDMVHASATLLSCRALGVSFALDDFGTGYSSLAYFRKLPIDMLKIDQSFVRDMLDDPNDLEIVQSVVRLAIAFDRTVIAEGVETLAHGKKLLSIGCHLCQGDGISPAMPADHVSAWLETWRTRAVWRELQDKNDTASASSVTD